jgi:hypothetical protein
VLSSTPIETLLKLESTSIKLRNLEKSKETEEKLAMNRDSLEDTVRMVGGGEDNRWSKLHEGRFLPGAACSAAKMWSRGREVFKRAEHQPLAVYDMACVGLAGHVTPKGWLVLADPGDSTISINLFSIANCGKKSSNKAGETVEDARDICELGELKVAIRVLREALSWTQPWNKSVGVLEGFMLQTDYCKKDLEGIDNQASILTQFVDYVLRENSNRWRGQESFLSIGDLKGVWESFFGSRPQSMLVKKKTYNQGWQQQGGGGQQGGSQGGQNGGGSGFGNSQNNAQSTNNNSRVPFKKVPDSYFKEDICVMFNIGKCVKPPGTCTTLKGRPLRHICNHRPDPNQPGRFCGATHAAVFYH